jgi:hypothetical protein
VSQDEYNPNSIDAVLARIEQRQKDNGEKLDAVIASHKARLDKHDERIGGLEKWRYYLLGACAIGGLVIKAAWDWAKSKI